MAPYPASAGAIAASAKTIAAIAAKISGARRIVPIPLVDFGYRLQSAARTLHCPLDRFWQSFMAASSAAARCGRVAAPQALPLSARAIAPHVRDAVRKMILHLPLPHSFVATSSALVCDTSSELRPYFLASSS